MTWLVFGVSCLLVLAGAVSIISGAPIVQIERGWTEVIAGTIALSSGGIVFALAAILVRLESVRDALAVPRQRAAEVPASEDTAASPMVAAAQVSVVSPAQAPDEAVVATEESLPNASDNETGQGLWKRVKRPGETALNTGAPDRGGRTDRARSAEITTPMHSVERTVTPPAPTAPVVAIDRTSETENPAENEPSQLGWLERSLFKGRLPKAVPDDRMPVLPEPAQAAEPSPNSAQPAGVSEGSPEAVETEAGVTVIGRYQAGVASYVMYSDGTIEVETEGGQSHRFASMEELKVFIANQDNVLS